MSTLTTKKFLYVPEIGTVSLIVSVIEISELPRTLSPPGPYIWTPHGPHRVYRLYEDTQQAFFSAMSQGGSADMPTFTEMRPATQIAVPSRLYYERPQSRSPTVRTSLRSERRV